MSKFDFNNQHGSVSLQQGNGGLNKVKARYCSSLRIMCSAFSQSGKFVLENASFQTSAQVYELGAHVTSWIVAGRERLFVSDKSEFKLGSAIRGWAFFRSIFACFVAERFRRSSCDLPAIC
jgi:hypothetical protein